MTWSPGVGEPRSTLARLFTYSKDTEFSAHENFTTEALAACIRADPTPLLDALRTIAAGPPKLRIPVAAATRVRVETQVYLPGGGILDALLTLWNEDGVVGEVWLEAKIDSPEGTDQLLRYDTVARTTTAVDGVDRDVIALSKVRLQESYAWLDWRQLYVEASRSVDRDWRELAVFMEETRVSDIAMLPISDREAGSMADAARLFAKVSEVLREVNREACRLWAEGPAAKGACWGTEGQLLNHVAAVFRQSGRMVMEGDALRYGAVALDGVAYWYLAVPARGRRSAALEQVVARAAERGLGPEWQVRLHLPEFISRTARVALYDDPSAASAWFKDGLGQLARSGLLMEMLDTPSGQTASEPVDAVEGSPPASDANVGP